MFRTRRRARLSRVLFAVVLWLAVAAARAQVPQVAQVAPMAPMAPPEGQEEAEVVSEAEAATEPAPDEPPAASDPVAGTGTADYEIEVRLDPLEKTLDGSQVLTWRNETSEVAEELRFHLYWNGWRNDQTTWLRESVVGQVRRRKDFDKVRVGDWGSCEVLSVRLLGDAFGEIELGEKTFFHATDDGNPHDRSVLVVPLPQPVAPGESIRVALDWSARIPRTFARTGYRGNFFFFAHWFPKLAVFQEDGTWNAHQFHAATEFFADYGEYDVKMTVPRGWKLGATGREVVVAETSFEGELMSTHHYHQSQVHGFAWTTSPDYLEAREMFSQPGLPAVEMRLLYQPEHQSQVARHFRATAAALQYYGTWYGAYPYPQITVIDPAWGSGAGGMEYPTLFTCGTRLFNPLGGGSPEGVTIHEAGHQFWYALVGSNEFEDAWLDEGLNTFSTARVYDVAYGDRFYVRRFLHDMFPVMEPRIKLTRTVEGNRLDRYRRSLRRDVPATPTFLYYPESASDITYAKTSLWLATLERVLGWDTLQQILATFFERWKFRHPRPGDFFAVANEVSGRDLTPFFDQVFRSASRFDYSVALVSSQKYKARGFFGNEGDLLYYDGESLPEGFAIRDPIPASSAADFEVEEGPDLYETRVYLRRLGDGVLPVDVLLRFENGDEIREVWDGTGLWKAYHLIRPARLESAVVDPERKLLLDIHYSNNSRLVDPKSSLAASKWASKWLFWLQDYLETLSFLM